MINIIPSNIKGFPVEEQARFTKLLNVYNQHFQKNLVKERYYEGRVTLNEVNLGLALPDGMAGLEIGCAWGAKTVDVLAGLSMFDGFVGANGADVADLERLVVDNNLIGELEKTDISELYDMGFTVREIEKLKGESKSSVSRKLNKEDEQNE